jgi:hypothetical protein
VGGLRVRIQKKLSFRTAFFVSTFLPLSMRDHVTAAVINYQTPEYLEKAVRSFRHFYPDVPLLVVDNGSKESSVQVIQGMEREEGSTVRGVYNEENRFHGPAMDQAITLAETPYVYLLDTDTETRRGGFLEEMISIMETEPRSFAVGKRVTVNKRGFVESGGVPVPVSAYMLIRKAAYVQLPPFEHHGLPVLRCCMEAARKGWRVAVYPVDGYVDHYGRGTADKYGYGLGWRSKLNYILNRIVI